MRASKRGRSIVQSITVRSAAVCEVRSLSLYVPRNEIRYEYSTTKITAFVTESKWQVSWHVGDCKGIPHFITRGVVFGSHIIMTSIHYSYSVTFHSKFWSAALHKKKKNNWASCLMFTVTTAGTVDNSLFYQHQHRTRNKNWREVPFHEFSCFRVSGVIRIKLFIPSSVLF